MLTEVRLRELSDEERLTITRLARLRTDEARLVQRARAIEQGAAKISEARLLKAVQQEMGRRSPS